jgi:hypothetical protein
MIIIDLICVATNHHSKCVSMLEMAKRRLEDPVRKSSREFRRPPSSKQSVHAHQILGVKDFLLRMHALMNLGREDHALLEQRSCSTALGMVTSPLDAEMMRVHAAALAMLSRELKRGEEALEQIYKESQEQEDGFPVLKTKKPVLRMAVKSLLEACRKHVPPQGVHHVLLR